MEEETSINAKAEIPTTHFFTYKGKKYPFNLDLFKIFSQYFSQDPPKEESINLIDENINISESSIPDFIKFCQARKISLTRDNVPSLHKLSQRFKVQSLFDITKEYISTHQKDVVVEMISMYHNDDNFPLEEYEDIISKDVINYVNNDILLTFPLPILHRIITKYAISYQNQTHSNNSEQPPELIEFLFKCLDHYGRNASVLFDHLDFFSCGGKIINRLLGGYSEKFDFHFVNPTYAKTVYALESEIIARDEQLKLQILAEKKEVELMAKQREEEKMKMDEIIGKFSLLVTQEIEKMKKQHEEEMKEKNEMIEKMTKRIEEMQSKHKEDLHKQQEEFNESMKKITEKLEQMKRKIAFSKFYSGSDPSGLLFILGEKVALSTWSYSNSSFPLQNIRKNDSSRFYNWGSKKPSSESDSFIIFDFGPSKKIDLKSYLIRSNGGNPSSNYHPKTWRIEGSNDGSSWINLDKRSNDENLNGSYKQCHFVCQFGNYGSESNLFQYIKYVQEDSWDSSCKYAIYITYFELYGDVITL